MIARGSASDCPLHVGRFTEIDIAKGVLAILVAVGHAVQQYDASLGQGWEIVRHVIYSFHMAAFVFVAGFCSVKMLSYQTVRDVGGYARGRALRLLLPYLSWGAIYLVLRAFAGDHARVPYDWDRWGFFFLGYNPDGAMWFLWALFVASVCIALFARQFARGWVVVLTWIFAVTWLMLQTTVDYLRGVNAVPVFLFFFSLGLLVRTRYDRLKSVFGGVAFAVLALVAFVVACCARQFDWQAGRIPWYAVSAPAGTMLVMSLSILAAGRSGPVSGGLAFLGKHAMAISVLGEPVKVACRMAFARQGIPSQLAFFAMLSLMLVIPVLVRRQVLKRCALASLALLGEAPVAGTAGSDDRQAERRP